MKVPNEYRVKDGQLASDDVIGNNGAFIVPFESTNLYVIASDQLGWEHVSVSKPNRCPSWKEMNFIKDMFWDAEETVVQFHPKKSQYVNNHEYCLHLWRKIDGEHELPPSGLIGFKV